ncbi:hypothetical protein SAMN04488055_5695 [Chitinophaga niabensis]|uniref:Uncharacterized protein n=1 Tax=Chitinophaga niabensis TaxID=536979 RepID=A0A1N6KEC5_9BACT|nr:hypothetical protein SAMN04488055_5695 [Chitinophaga niabensis]
MGLKRFSVRIFNNSNKKAPDPGAFLNNFILVIIRK